MFKFLMMYKLQFYYTSGPNKGNREKEELFATYEGMKSRYKEVFRHDLYSLNPTAWKYNGEDWERLSGF